MKNQKFGLTVDKQENFAEWYTQVITKGEILDYYDVKGCYILRPNGQFIWTAIKKWFNKEIEKIDVDECSFPMLIPKSHLEKEKNHINDFSPEVAWITKCGDEELGEPVAIRPTSETVFYPSFSKWIKSHRDLPLKLNQWCNILRWELRGTMPLLRSKEINWQEGHTAFLTKEEADEEVLYVLNLYYMMYRDLLAVPVIKGLKTENEKFAGADYTTTVEGYIPESGRGIQAATSHSLGQNFSKIFDIKIQNEDNKNEFVYQNSWGMTTRSIGIAIMLHSDNKGLVIPPWVSKIQVVIVPCGITIKTTKNEKENLMNQINEIYNILVESKIRAYVDDRHNVTAGFKFNHWEIRGVPLRLELGLRDIKKKEICVFQRHNNSKKIIKYEQESFSKTIKKNLQEIHDDLFKKAYEVQQKNIKYVENFEEFSKFLNDKCLLMTPWCENTKCEEEIKTRSILYKDDNVVLSGAKSLCIPFEAKKLENKTCIICNGKCKRYTLFGRSY